MAEPTPSPAHETTVRKLRGALYDAVQVLEQARERVERENRSLSADPFAEWLRDTARRGRETLRSTER